MKRFMFAAVSFAVIVLIYYLRPAPPTDSDPDMVDKAIREGMPIILLLASGVMVLSRTSWTIRGIGVFYVTIASGLLLFVIEHRRDMDPGNREFVTDLARAAYIIGGPALLFGLLSWIWFWIKHRTDTIRTRNDDIDGTPFTDPGERRLYDRRQETRDMKAELRRYRGEPG